MPSEREIERIMREEGFDRMQAINHARIMAAGRRSAPRYPFEQSASCGRIAALAEMEAMAR